MRLSPSDPGFYQNPYPAYDRFRDQGPAFYWEDYGIWCFPGFEEVDAILRDRRFGREITHIVSREALGWPEIPEHVKPFYDFEAHSMLEREPPVHTRLRRLVNRAFVSRQIEKLRPQIETLANHLIDRFETAGEADLLPTFATPIPVIVITRLLGVPDEMAPQLLEWSHKMVAMYQFNHTRKTEDEAVEATLGFSAYIRDLVAERRRQARQDNLLGVLIAAEEGGDRLSEDELITSTILLLNAGHEATVHGIGNGIKALLQQDCDTTRLFRSETAAARTVEELLRFDPPLHLFTRYALEDMDVFGVTLKQGESVGLLLGAANRDPRRFEAPSHFDPERTDGAHVSFGAGIHFCVGAPLARLEMQVALKTLFTRLPRLRLVEPPQYADRYHFHGLEALRVTW